MLISGMKATPRPQSSSLRYKEQARASLWYEGTSHTLFFLVEIVVARGVPTKNNGPLFHNLNVVDTWDICKFKFPPLPFRAQENHLPRHQDPGISPMFSPMFSLPYTDSQVIRNTT